MKNIYTILLSLISLGSFAQLSLTGSGVTETIDFEGTKSGVNEGLFTSMGLAPSPAAGQLDSDGWQIDGLSQGNTSYGGTHTTSDYSQGVTSGGVFSGGIYAFDANGNTCLGVQPTGGDWTPGSITLRVQNNTGGNLDSIQIAYDLIINNDADRGNDFNFSYSTDDVTYSADTNLNYTSIELSQGSVIWDTIPRQTTVFATVPAGGFFYIRWSGADNLGSGGRDEFGLDNIAVTGFGTAAAPSTYTLQILHASDLEGGVDAVERAKYFAAIVDTLEDEYANSVTLSAGDNYIPGPFFNAAADRATFRDGGVFNNVYNRHFGVTTYDGLREEGGRADITIMNIIGFDASAIGNHEFDAGADAMENIIEEDFRSPNGPASDRWVGAQFPYLSANLDFSGSSDLGNLYEGTVQENTTFQSGPAQTTAGNSSISKVAASTFISRGGELIGVVGATTPRLATISSPGAVTVTGPTTDDMVGLAAEIQPWVDSLENHGVNKIILVTHLQQVQLEEQLATLVSGVDVIIAGGSDAILANANNRLHSGAVVYKPYPILSTNLDGDPIAIVSTDGEYSYVGRLVVDFDSAGVLNPASIDTAVSGPYIADSAMTAMVSGGTAFSDPNGKGALVDSITTAVRGVVIAKDGTTFGNTTVYLNGERTSVRTEETNFGNLSADANLWQAQQYDANVQVSIKNGGGIRAAIGEVVEVAPGVFNTLPPQANPVSGKQTGEISQLDIENTLRFNNGLSVMDLTATDLKTIIEHGVAATAPGATPGQFAQVGGLRFSFDSTQSSGSRVVDMFIVDSAGNDVDTVVMAGNVMGNASRTIKIVTLDFLAGGGDGYSFNTLGTNRVDLDTVSTIPAGAATFATSGTEQDALAEYLTTFYSTTPFDEEDELAYEDERIVNIFATAPIAYTLQVLHASDLEGGVEAVDRAKYFAAIVDTLEDAFANSITLSAGDNYIPGPFFNAAADRATFRDGGVFNNVYNRHFGITTYNGLREEGGRADITIMNIIGFDASAIGNHEFDAGADAMEQIIEEDFRSPNGPASDRWVGAQFPYLSANLDFSGSGDLGNLYTGTIEENTSFQSGPAQSQTGNTSYNKIAAVTYIVEGGEKIGVVGVTTPRLATISSPGDVQVTGPTTDDMIALAAEVQPWIDSLVDSEGINKVVLVTHLQQVQLEEQLATLLSDVDIIIAGGSDAILANNNHRLNPGSVIYKPYPIITQNLDGDDLAIVSTDGEYSYVGRLVAGFDPNGKLIASTIDSTVSGPYIADSMMVSTVWGGANGFADPNGKGALVDSITTAVRGVVIAKDGNTFGYTDEYLNGERSSVRTEETNFGNLSADANLWQAIQYDPTVQVSIKNGGGIRAAIGEVVETSPGVFDFLPPQANPVSGKQDGEISQLDIENTLRFNNGLSVLDLTATDLKTILEHGVGAWAVGATPGQFCQVGGIEFSFDPAQPNGSRIWSAVIIDTTGNPVDTLVKEGSVFGNASRTIRIVTLDFLAGGGDGYAFNTLGSNRVDLDTASTIPSGNATFATSGTEQDALAEYLSTFHSTANDAFDEEDTDIDDDERIQNLMFRDDFIFNVFVEFDEERVSVEESAGTVNLQVNYDNGTSTDTEINFSVLGISTADGSDYTINLSDTARANTVGTFNLSWNVTDDNSSENDELVFIEIVEDSTYLLDDDENNFMVAFIRDNDNTGPTATETIKLNLLTSYQGLVNAGSTEILAYDSTSQRMFVTNSSNDRFEILDFSNPSNITRLDSIDISNFGAINSLSVYNGVVACAIEDTSVMGNGTVAFYDTLGTLISSVTAGVLPDMVTFTPDGNTVVVANEGEPSDDYTMDPEGSISIIDVSGGIATLTQADVTTLNFTSFNSQLASLRSQGVRIFGPNATVAQDLEPEYVAISPDNTRAYVAAQEANALITVDLVNNSILSITALGWKDHSLAGNGLDSDRRSNNIHIAQAPFRGFYMPDAIAAYEVNGTNYVISANEGDSRDYDGYSEEDRLDDLDLDPTVFPDEEAIFEAYGDIKVTLANGDIDNDGDYDAIYTYGARSFTIWNASTGALVYDSGDDFEQIISNHPEYFKLFNVTDDGSTIKNRSDDKGPEPEAVVIGTVRNKEYAFIGMERTGGVMVYDVSNPNAPVFVDVNIPRDTADGSGDQAPEGLVFIPRSQSPLNNPILVAANEESNTLSVWEITDSTTSIREVNGFSNELTIYPNPTRNQLFVTTERGQINEIQMFDMRGRMVRNIQTPRQLHRIDVSDLEPNMYLLQIHTDEGIKSSKVIVQ